MDVVSPRRRLQIISEEMIALADRTIDILNSSRPLTSYQKRVLISYTDLEMQRIGLRDSDYNERGQELANHHNSILFRLWNIE